MVCTGNICRSPMAEHVLRQAFDDAGLGAAVTVSIAQFGSTRSINAGAAAAIALHAWVRRHVFGQRP